MVLKPGEKKITSIDVLVCNTFSHKCDTNETEIYFSYSFSLAGAKNIDWNSVKLWQRIWTDQKLFARFFDKLKQTTPWALEVVQSWVIRWFQPLMTFRLVDNMFMEHPTLHLCLGQLMTKVINRINQKVAMTI